jgi:hypothetical protein
MAFLSSSVSSMYLARKTEAVWKSAFTGGGIGPGEGPPGPPWRFFLINGLLTIVVVVAVVAVVEVPPEDRKDVKISFPDPVT